MNKFLISLSLCMGIGGSVALAQQPAVCAPDSCVPAPCSPCVADGDSIVAVEVVENGCFCGNFNPDGRKHPGNGKHKKGHKKGHKKANMKGFKKGAGRDGHNPNGSFSLEGLNLTPGQQAEVNAMVEERANENKKIAQDAQKKREKVKEKYDKKLKKILSPEQYAQYKSNAGRVRRAPGSPREGVVGPVVRGPEPMIMTD